jgi:hypothetical protein
MESFWGSMQIEFVNRQKWQTHLELAIAIADYNFESNEVEFQPFGPSQCSRS